MLLIIISVLRIEILLKIQVANLFLFKFIVDCRDVFSDFFIFCTGMLTCLNFFMYLFFLQLEGDRGLGRVFCNLSSWLCYIKVLFGLNELKVLFGLNLLRK